MRRNFIFNFAIILISFSLILFYVNNFSFAAERGAVKGKVTDKKSKSPLPGITITVEGTDAISFTDEKGNYSLDLPEGTYTIRAELLGYKIAEAKGVVVLEGETNNINFAMEEIGVIRGEEVVVTGERMDVPLSRTTASVSVVSSEQSKDLAVAGNASDLLAYTPGVQMEGGGGGATKTIKIRGATIAPPKVTTAGILLLVDGVPMNDPISGYASIYMIPSENIERIEVLKGASSAQYGSQAAAGVINIITKKGKKDPRTSFDISYGTYQYRSNAEREYLQNYSFSHSWGGEKFDYSISGSYGKTTGFTTAETAPVGILYRNVGRKFPGQGRTAEGVKILPDGSKEIPAFLGKSLNELMDFGSDQDQIERYTFNISFGFKPFKNNTFRINPGYSFLNFFTAFTPNVAPLTKPDQTYLQIVLNVINRRDYLNVFDEWKITPKLTYKIRAGAQKSTEAGLFLPVVDFKDYPKELEALGFKDGYNGEDPSTPFQTSPGTTIGKSWNVANDLSYDFDILDGNTLSIGHEYLWTKMDAALGKNEGQPTYLKTPLYRRFASLYFQNMQKFGKFTFSMGGRWDQGTSFIDDFSDEFSPRLGINYELFPGTSLRTSIGRARRFPEFARTHGLAQSNGVLFGNPAEGPEITWSYELGFRFLTKFVGADIAYFYNDYSDFETPIPLNIGSINEAKTAKAKREYMRVYNYVKKYYPFEMPSPQEGLTAAKFAQLVYGGIVEGKEYARPTAGIFVNGPDVVYQGIDSSVDLFLMKNWNMNFSYLFTRAVVGNPNPFDFSQGTKQPIILSSTGVGVGPYFLGGNRLIYIPTHVFKVSTNYTLPFGLRVITSGRFKSTATTISRSAVGGQFRMPEHWIWEFKLIQPFFKDKLKLSFSIDNVFSKRYYAESIIPSAVARYDVGLSYSF